MLQIPYDQLVKDAWIKKRIEGFIGRMSDEVGERAGQAAAEKVRGVANQAADELGRKAQSQAKKLPETLYQGTGQTIKRHPKVFGGIAAGVGAAGAGGTGVYIDQQRRNRKSMNELRQAILSKTGESITTTIGEANMSAQQVLQDYFLTKVATSVGKNFGKFTDDHLTKPLKQRLADRKAHQALMGKPTGQSRSVRARQYLAGRSGAQLAGGAAAGLAAAGGAGYAAGRKKSAAEIFGEYLMSKEAGPPGTEAAQRLAKFTTGKGGRQLSGAARTSKQQMYENLYQNAPTGNPSRAQRLREFAGRRRNQAIAGGAGLAAAGAGGGYMAGKKKAASDILGEYFLAKQASVETEDEALLEEGLAEEFLLEEAENILDARDGGFEEKSATEMLGEFLMLKEAAGEGTQLALPEHAEDFSDISDEDLEEFLYQEALLEQAGA